MTASDTRSNTKERASGPTVDERLSAVEAQADRIEAKLDQALRALEVTSDVLSHQAAGLLHPEGME